MRNASENYTNITSHVEAGSSVTGATLVNTTVQNNATVVSSNLTGSTIIANATVTNSTLTSATVSNSTLTNVTVRSDSRITNVSINDTSLGTSMNFSMIVNLSNPAVINVSETGISPDGAGFSSGIRLGNFLYIRSNDTNPSNVTTHIMRLYFDITYTGGVAIYYYNTSAATPAWQALTTTGSGTEGGRYYIEARPDHLSTFGLLGTTTTTTTPPSSGGTGSGGEGPVTSEPYDNTAKSERYDKSLIANTSVTYTFKEPELGIYEIAITGKENENDIALRVEVLKGTSKLVSVQASGIVYKNVNVWAGSKKIKEAVIRFRGLNSWLSDNGIGAADIRLVRWDGTKWVQLETAQNSKDSTYTYFEAKTTAFANFAITGSKGEIAPTATTEPQASEPVTTVKETPVESQKKGTPGFEFVLSVMVLSILYLFVRTRR
jgi:PGF-pre-PGF domain-containing protein